MSKPDIQYFDRDDTWVRPDRASAIDVLVIGGGAGGTADAPGESGQASLKRFCAPDIPPSMEIEVGKGGRGTGGGQDGRDGCAVVITYLEGEPAEAPAWVEQFRDGTGANSSRPPYGPNPNAVMTAIASAQPLPWTVEVTFRTKAGEALVTWNACEVTSLDQTVSLEIPVGRMLEMESAQ